MNSGFRIQLSQGFILVGHALFLGLFILSYLHFRERVINVDSALQIFKWVEKTGVEVEVYRFSAVFPQLVVKLAKGMGFGLQELLRIASLAHVAVAYLIFVLAAHVWRTTWVAAAAALAAVLCTRLTFYGVVLEANYLLSYPFLLAAVLEGPVSKRPSEATWGLAFLALAMILLVHPVGFLISLFVLFFFLSIRPKLRNGLLLLILITVLWGVLGRLLLPPSGYESGLYAAVITGLQSFGEPGRWPSTEYLLGHSSGAYTTHYLPAWILLGVAFFSLMRQREFALTLLTLFAACGYVLLNVITYHEGEVAMMMEKNFLPLATLIALPLMYAVSRWNMGSQIWAILPFTLVVFLQFRGISFAARPAQARQAAMTALVEEARAKGLRKVFVSEEELRESGIPVFWALPFECMLSSALNGPEETVTISFDPQTTKSWYSGVELAPWINELPVEKLDQRYFRLPKGAYSHLSGSLPQR